MIAFVAMMIGCIVVAFIWVIWLAPSKIRATRIFAYISGVSGFLAFVFVPASDRSPFVFGTTMISILTICLSTSLLIACVIANRVFQKKTGQQINRTISKKDSP